MKGLFSRKLYIEGLKRIKIAGVAAAITVILLNAVLPLIEILNSRRIYGMTDIVGWSVTSVEPYEFMPIGLLMLAFGAVFAFSMFSFLNERNRSDFFHAIPHKRICVYFSFIAAIFTWIFAILAVSAGVNAVLYGFSKFYSVNFSVVIVTPLVLLIASTMIAAFMTLAMTLTGTVISNSLIFVLLLLFGRTIGQIFVTSLRELAPILRYGNSFLNYLEFNFSLPFTLLVGEGFDNTSLVIYTVIVTLLVFAAGAVCYVTRKSETATKSAPSKFLQHVYRSAITLPFFLFVVLTAIVDGLDFSTQLVMLVLAILVYCIFELMTTKKIKTLLGALPMIFIPILLSGAFTGAVFAARNAVLNQVPELSEIEAIGKQESIRYDPTYRELRTNDTFIDSEEAKAIVRGALKRDIEQIRKYGNTAWVILGDGGGKKVDIYTKETIKFQLKNGRTIDRYIGLTEAEYEGLMSLFLKSTDYLEAYLDLPTSREIDSIHVNGYDFDTDDVKRLWASFMWEFDSLSREEKLAYAEKNYRNEEVARFYVGGTYRLKTFHSNYAILYEYMPKTAQMYLELAAKEGVIQDDMTTLNIIIDQLSRAEGENVENHFSIIVTPLVGKNVGNEYYVESVKTEIELPREKAVQMLEFLVEHGKFSYKPTDTVVRFTVQLYDIFLYDFNADSYTLSYSYSSSLASSKPIAESSEVMNARIILSFTEEEWLEFMALIGPYHYQ